LKNYTTKDIVNQIADTIRKDYPILLNYVNFDDWEKEFRAIENIHIVALFPEHIHGNFPLKNDVLKLIIKNIFHYMPFSKAYILNNYEKNLDGIDYLIYPVSDKLKAKRMMIFFSGFSGRKTYNRFSWYWDEAEVWDRDTVYLFLNDLSETWYVGTPEKPRFDIYVKIIENVLTEYMISRDAVFTVGGSMGGYASILFAFEMKLKGCIAVHPQITYKATRKYINSSWEAKIRTCQHLFYDLTDYIFKTSHRPLIYIEYGMSETDVQACEEFIEALQKKECLCFFRKSANPSHNTDNPSLKTVQNLINFFENNGYEDGYIGSKD